MLFRGVTLFLLALSLAAFSVPAVAFAKPLAQCPPQVAEGFLGAPADPEKIDEILKAAVTGKSRKYPLGPGWRILSPLLTERPRGLEALRKLIAEEGLVQVISQWASTLGPEKLPDFFGGAKILRVKDSPDKPWNHKGVFLHTSGMGLEAEPLNSHRGTANPHLGFANLHGILSDNRIAEYELAEANWPGIMAKTEIVRDLRAKGHLPPKFFERLERVKNGILRENPYLMKDAIESLLTDFFAALNRLHPEGAFIKNYGESTTGDLNNQVTSHGSNPKAMATYFMDRVSRATKSKAARKGFESRDFQKRLPDGLYDTTAKFVSALLLSPETIIAQKKVDIMQTPLGNKMEFRVDFIDGEPVYVKLRFSNEYFPEHAHAAGELIRAFFARLPKEFRYLSGGADVAFLADGTLSIIEFNYGSTSGSLCPTIFPIDSSELISNLTGNPAPLIVKLEQAFALGVPGLRALLKTARFEKEQWEKRGWVDISLFEYAKWIRNRYMRLWLEKPTALNADRIMDELDAVYKDFGSPENKDLIELYAGAENYIKMRLNN